MTGWRAVSHRAVEAATQAAADRSGASPSASEVGPGLVGFLATFAVVGVTVLLMLDLTRRLRRLRYRAELADRAVGPADGLPTPESDANDASRTGAAPTAHTKKGREPRDRPAAAAVETEVGDERNT